jgi:hypothetical protein
MTRLLRLFGWISLGAHLLDLVRLAFGSIHVVFLVLQYRGQRFAPSYGHCRLIIASTVVQFPRWRRSAATPTQASGRATSPAGSSTTTPSRRGGSLHQTRHHQHLGAMERLDARNRLWRSRHTKRENRGKKI